MIAVRDLARSERFYVRHFGFHVAERLESLRRLERPGATLGATAEGAPRPMPRVELQVFRPERDLSLIATWLSRAHVSRWWGEPSQALSEVSTHDAETAALITLDAQPVGFLCWQTPSPAELNDAGLADLPSDLVDVDIMIGEPIALGQGAGPEALRQLFDRLRDRGVRLVGLGTALANERAIAAYPKAALQPYRDFVESGEPYRYFTRSLA